MLHGLSGTVSYEALTTSCEYALLQAVGDGHGQDVEQKALGLGALGLQLGEVGLLLVAQALFFQGGVDAGVEDVDGNGSMPGSLPAAIHKNRGAGETTRDRDLHSPVVVNSYYPSVSNELTKVEFLVDEEGNVRDPHVVRATERGFAEAALRAVAKWKFEPGFRNGRRVRYYMAVPVSFRLDAR